MEDQQGQGRSSKLLVSVIADSMSNYVLFFPFNLFHVGFWLKAIFNEVYL